MSKCDVRCINRRTGIHSALLISATRGQKLQVGHQTSVLLLKSKLCVKITQRVGSSVYIKHLQKDDVSIHN